MIQALAPFRSQPSPWRTARVFMPPGFEPASGSVRPKQPIASPLARRGSQDCFCASDPNAWIGYITSAPCTDTNERRPESPRSSSCMMRPYATGPSPAQPYPSRFAPSRPMAAIPGIRLVGKVPSRKWCSMTGSTFSCTKSRTVSRTIFSSSLYWSSSCQKSSCSKGAAMAVPLFLRERSAYSK